jgi:hypothetical protein
MDDSLRPRSQQDGRFIQWPEPKPPRPKSKRAKPDNHWYKVGPYSSDGAIAALDGRQKELRYLKTYRAELVAHIGGEPTPIQWELIGRAAILALRCRMMDHRLLENDGSGFTNNDSTQFCAWSNSLSRTLTLLDLTVTGGRGKGAKPRFLRNRSSIEALRTALSADGATVADLVGGDKP